MKRYPEDDEPRAIESATIPPWARGLVRLLDEAVTIPGTNFKVGLDGILGLVFPGLGDALMASSGLLLIGFAFFSGVPGVVLLRMAVNVALDALFGIIPLVGDVFDFGFKSNRKNIELIERFERPGAKATPRDYAFVVLSVVTVLVILISPIVLFIALLSRLLGSH